MGSVGADDVSGAVSETAFGDTRDNQEQHKESTADPQASSPSPNQEEPEAANGASPPPSVKKEVSSSKPALPPFVDDPNKITLKFIFANRDGLHVIVDCKPGDSVGEVKGALLSMWPKGKLCSVPPTFSNLETNFFCLYEKNPHNLPNIICVHNIVRAHVRNLPPSKSIRTSQLFRRR
mmetsp:Transcript_15722/g.20926  ORF Transcript_15722/g.20926 Transcript_15722/m.20926 type:complete len:178 (-) Transcript_15722:501-1034(-)